jgi:hypothetical protein
MRSRDSFLLQYIFDRVMAVGATNKPIAKTHEQAEPADNRAPTSVRPPAVSASIACSRCRCSAAGAPAIHPVRLALADCLRSFFACVAFAGVRSTGSGMAEFPPPSAPPSPPPSLPAAVERAWNNFTAQIILMVVAVVIVFGGVFICGYYVNKSLGMAPAAGRYREKGGGSSLSGGGGGKDEGGTWKDENGNVYAWRAPKPATRSAKVAVAPTADDMVE